jgi:hypothetical protein
MTRPLVSHKLRLRWRWTDAENSLDQPAAAGRLLTALVLSFVGYGAVTLHAAPSVLSPADSAWAALQALGASPSGQGAVAAPQSDAAQTTRLQSEIAAANAFCTAFGTDGRAAVARKVEALCYLQMAQFGSPDSKAAALLQANLFRQDVSVPVRDRFDLALAIESQALAAKAGAASPPSAAALVALADSLHAEFGEQDPVYDQYTSLILSLDQPTALALAQKILSFNPPARAKAIATAVVARSALIGKPLKLALTLYGGRPMDLSQPVGEPTVIYFWSNRLGLADLAAFAGSKASIGYGCRIIYVCLQADLSAVSAAEAQAPLPGAFCFEPSGLQGAEEVFLGLTQLPFVYVLDQNANLVGYGGPDAIPALMGLVQPQDITP